MAKNRIKGITVEIGGDTTELQKSLKDVDKTLKSTQDNLKDINKLLKMDPSNTTLLKQKQEELSKAIAASKDRVKELKNALKEMQNAPNASETVEQQKLLAREIADTEQKLKSLKEEMRDFGSVAKQQLMEAGDKMKDVGGKISDVGGKLTTSVTLPLAAMGGVAVKAASDYEENINKLNVAFGEFADEVRDFSDNAQIDFGLSKNDASESAAAFGALAKGIGLSEEQAASMSVELTKLSADLGSYFNTDIEQSAGALEGIFTGNATALKKFGVVMTDANLEEFAKSIGMTAKQYKALGQEDKTLLRFQYVMAATADAQGDFARTNDGTANSMKSFQASIADLTTVLGEQLIPIITPVIQKITEIIQKFASMDSETAKLIITIAGVVAAVGPVLTIIGNIVSGVGMLTQAISFLMSPMGLIVVGIAAVVAAGVALYQNWDTVKQKASELWENLKGVWDNIKSTISGAIDVIKEKIQGFIDKIRDLFDISSGLSKIGDFFSGIGSKIGGMFSSGGYMSAGYMSGGTVTIYNSFAFNGIDLNDRQAARRFADMITDRVDENLGRRYA